MRRVGPDNVKRSMKHARMAGPMSEAECPRAGGIRGAMWRDPSLTAFSVAALRVVAAQRLGPSQVFRFRRQLLRRRRCDLKVGARKARTARTARSWCLCGKRSFEHGLGRAPTLGCAVEACKSWTAVGRRFPTGCSEHVSRKVPQGGWESWAGLQEPSGKPSASSRIFEQFRKVAKQVVKRRVPNALRTWDSS